MKHELELRTVMHQIHNTESANKGKARGKNITTALHLQLLDLRAENLPANVLLVAAVDVDDRRCPWCIGLLLLQALLAAQKTLASPRSERCRLMFQILRLGSMPVRALGPGMPLRASILGSG